MPVSTTTLLGNLTQVEMSVGPTGSAFTKASLAVSGGKDMNGEDKDTMWFNIKAWGDLAENIAETYQNAVNQGKKSFRAVITGKIVPEVWEDAQGNKRSATTVHVEDLGVSLRYNKVGSIIDSQNEMNNNAKKSAAFSQMKKASELETPAPAPAAAATTSSDETESEVPF
jgi:single stranded DNA-binding protein